MTLVANEKDCYVDLEVIAIGGGGHGARGAGAGSGYVEAGRIRLLINNPAIEVTVGSSQAPSKVEVGGEVLLEAAPGQTNVTCGTACGADGYSGGGGYGGDRYGWGGGGGSDGSDGKDSSDQKGGKGSGLDQCPAGRVFQYRVGSGWVLDKIPGSGSGFSRVGVPKNTIGYVRVSFLLSGMSGYFGYFRVFLGLPIYTKGIF